MSSIWSLMRAFAWGTSYSARYKMFCGGFEAADKSHRRWRNARGACRPGRDTAVRRKSFLPYFLYFTKSRKRPPQSGGRLPQATQKGGMAAGKEAAERQKKHTECAVPEGTNFLRSGKFQKDLILFVVRCYLGALNRGSQNLGAPCEGERLVTFCIVQKVTKKHTGLRPATSIQISARFKIFAEMTGHHQVTGRTGKRNLPGYRR